MSKKLTQKYLKCVLDYNPETGVFVWKTRTDVFDNWNTRWAGKETGWNHSNGYKQTCIGRKKYFLHRLAWLYVYGKWPKEIDHIDRNKANNRIRNLREVSHIRNCYNRDSGKKSVSGYKGVSFDKRGSGYYQANLRVNNRTVYLGRFKCSKDAYAAYCKARKDFEYEFARLA